MPTSIKKRNVEIKIHQKLILTIQNGTYSAGLESGIDLDNEISSEHTIFIP